MLCSVQVALSQSPPTEPGPHSIPCRLLPRLISSLSSVRSRTNHLFHFTPSPVSHSQPTPLLCISGTETATMASALDDEELSIPTSASARRSHQHSQRHHQRRDRDREQAIVETRGKQQSIERHGSIQQLGAYTILRTLGEGSFGKVKLAVNQLTRQQVAFKIINRKKLVTRRHGRSHRERD